MILLVQTTTFSAHGGIPTYNRAVCQVLQGLAVEREKHLLIQNDSPADIESPGKELLDLRISTFSGRRFALVAHLFRIILTKRVDLLLIGHVNHAPLGMVLKLLRPRLRYGVMVHGIEVWRRLPKLKRYGLQSADFLTSVSQYTKDRVVSLNDVASDRVYLLANALECSGDLSRETTLVLPSGLKLLSVCRLDSRERYKGVDTVIDALPEVLRQVPDLNYYVIGDGTDLERHKTLAQERGVADRVHFLGSVEASTLQAYYQACDVFVMPSAGEGFGIVYLEAMQHRKPVIASTSGAVPEVVLDGITGHLVDYGNKEQLARVLIALCLNSEERTRLGSAGYQRLLENFTCSHFKDELTKIVTREMPRRMFSSTQAQIL